MLSAGHQCVAHLGQLRDAGVQLGKVMLR